MPIRMIQKIGFAMAAMLLLSIVPMSAGADDIQSEIKKDPMLSAMQAELGRAQKDLKLPDQPVPYFIGYWVQESADVSLVGKHGGITRMNPDQHPTRYAGVQVRVGDYGLDNTNLPMNQRFDQASYNEFLEENDWRAREVPIEGSGAQLRAALWTLTDTAYKRAIGDFQKKKSFLATGIDKDRAEDFSREKPVVVLEPVVELGIALDEEKWKAAIRTVTGYLASQPNIMDPTMDIQAAQDVNYYVNTEGTVARTSAVIYNISITAWTRTEDGMRVSDFRHIMVRDAKELPGVEKLMAEAKALAQELTDLRTAEEFSPYSGPAILGPDVAGVFFHEALGHRLEGERQRMDDSGQTFKGKVGEKVLSDQITVYDDPSLAQFKGRSLVGYYHYDDEVVPARKVTLIEKGVLRNYLMSRTPIKGFNMSNGHGRSQNPAANSYFGHAVGRMGNLIVESSNTYSMEKLKKKLIEEAKKQGKPYGLIIRHVYGGDTNTQNSGRSSDSRGSYQAFKATPVLVYAVDVKTGKEKLVRGVEVVGTPLASLERVIAAGDDADAFNGVCGAESGWVPVSVIAPSILTAQVELQRTGGTAKRSPILVSPFLEK